VCRLDYFPTTLAERVVGMTHMIKGTVKVDRRTKNMVKRLNPSDIAVIDHLDLDEVAAESLTRTGIKYVINASKSISGRYPNPGPRILLDAGVQILDNVDNTIMDNLKDGDSITIIDNSVYKNDKLLARGQWLTREMVEAKMDEAKANLDVELEKFIRNTLDYAHREQGLILGKLDIPDVNVDFKGKQVLIVVRGQNYREDLAAIKSYIKEVRPVLVGVDGGADALVEFGYTPDVVIGDMDSISDKTLRCGAEIIVHAYPDGRAPGLERIRALGLTAKIFPAPGTSEDIAMLLAYEKGAELIVAVGTHSNIIDFLEKGRKGMSSTFLVRLKVGSILVDAKGVSRLYKSPMKYRYIAEIFLAAMLPLALVIALAPPTQQLLQLLAIKIRVIFGI